MASDVRRRLWWKGGSSANENASPPRPKRSQCSVTYDSMRNETIVTCMVATPINMARAPGRGVSATQKALETLRMCTCPGSEHYVSVEVDTDDEYDKN